MDEEQIKQEFEKVWREINGLKKIGSHIDEETIPLNSKKVSIKEFLIEKKPHKDFHKTLAICYYIEKNGTESFNAKDIENGFREAKEIIPRKKMETTERCRDLYDIPKTKLKNAPQYT